MTAQAWFDRAGVANSSQEARRRAADWWWPCTQMAVAAGIAWLVADTMVDSGASYAPITAIVTMGLGRERRLGRSMQMLAGLLIGAGAAVLAEHALGSGAWQIGLVLGVTAFATAVMLGNELAITYAAINGGVLLAIEGSGSWAPGRLASGAIGIVVAVFVTHVILPPHPVHQVERRIRHAVEAAGVALRATLPILRELPTEDPDAEQAAMTEAIGAASRIDNELQRLRESTEHAVEVSNWAPMRRPLRSEVERLSAIEHDLRLTLMTASTIARLAHRLALDGAGSPDHDGDDDDRATVASGIELAADALGQLTASFVDGRQPDDDTVAETERASERVVSASSDRAATIAIKEEVRGLLDDIRRLIRCHVTESPGTDADGSPGLGAWDDNANSQVSGRRVDGVSYGDSPT